MSQILNKVRDVDPGNNDAVKEVLSTFFQNLSKHTDVDSNRWLRALENIINRFPKFCGTHRNTIETYLTNFLDSTNYYNVIEAAKCAHALQQVRPSQEKAATPKACWREHLVVLSNAAHNLLSSMFPNSVDMYKNSENVQKLQLQSSGTSPLVSALDEINTVPKAQNTNVNKQTLFTTRLRNVFVFLQATLVEIYPVPKPIQPQTILEVVVRALSISSGVKQNQDVSKVVAVKVQALRTLDALVACLGPNLIPFSALIFKFVLQTLKWCSENVNEQSSQVRRGAYDTLRRWLRTLNTHRLADSSRGRNWEDELAQHIIEDITPAKHIVQLTMSSQSTKHLSKKAKRKLANSMLQESSIASHSPGEKNKISVSEETNDEIALSALDCAETFLHVCGVFLKPTTHKVLFTIKMADSTQTGNSSVMATKLSRNVLRSSKWNYTQLLQDRLVRECYNMDAYSGERGLGLVRVLEALRKTTPSSVPPPTQYCLQLYSVFVNSRIGELSKFCSQALLDLRLHLHCSPPSLNFAIEAPVAQKHDKTKKMSAKNRAALESLLGADKVPSEPTEEVITIADEPSKKKPRLDDDVEIADKISVSSESANSVEISDDDSDVLEIDADLEGEETADKSLEPPELLENTAGTTEYTADTTENTADTNDNTADTNENTENTHENTADVNVNTAYANKNIAYITNELAEKAKESAANALETSDVSQNIEEESQEIIRQATIEEVRTNNKETKDTAVEVIESTEKTEESPVSEERDTTDASAGNIYTAQTQIPSIASSDNSQERNSPHSMEVAYDFPSTATEKVTILEKPEDDNLPCTNDTDDIAITCGQVVKNSQDEIEKNKEEENKEVENKENEKPKVNGDKSPEKAANILTEKTADAKDVTVEDMLADFVDEINEEKIEP